MNRRASAAVAVVCIGISGAVYMTAQSAQPGALRQVAFLKASNPNMFDHFGEGGALDGHIGNSVAVSGDGNTIAIAAQHEGSNATGINGNQNDESTYNAGAVYVFVRSGAGWAQQAYVKASNTGSGDQFGNYVALSADGNTMAVAAYWESSSATGINGNQADDSIPQSGAVYVFTRTGTTWSQQAYIKASNTGNAGVGDVPGEGDQFGFSLAISDDGNTLAVGAPSEDSITMGVNGDQRDNSASSAGAVYVYTRTGIAWSQQAYIKSDAPPKATGGDQFGFSVALSANGSTLAVGAYDEGGSARGINGTIDMMRNGSGAGYVFTRTGTTWARQAYLKAWNSEGGDSWGIAVALSDDGNTMVLGSADEDCLCPGVVHAPSAVGDGDRQTDRSSGAAAVFTRNGTTWSQQAFIKASNASPNDWLAARMSLSGDGSTLLLGAQNEDSAAQGINGRQDDNAADDSGAAYLFTRSGNTWSQQAYIKGSNTQQFDEFGGSVGISTDGRTLVMGARGEDSNARGVNGNQQDNSVDEAGAAYVFTR